jgi:hypothetical protein
MGLQIDSRRRCAASNPLEIDKLVAEVAAALEHRFGSGVVVTAVSTAPRAPHMGARGIL